MKYKASSVLITGAGGFIGSHLAMMLVEEGYNVILISSKPRSAIHSSVCWEVINLEDKEKIEPLIKAMDRVDHCCFLAAKKTRSDGSKNLRTVNRLIDSISTDAFVNSKCPSAVYVSGLSIFQGTSSGTITEDSIPNPSSEYTQSKLAGEKYFESSSRRAGKTWRILRLNAPYGPGMVPNAVVHKFISRAIADEDLILHGDGSREQYFTWIEDCCRATTILFHRESGIYHFCGPEKVSMRTLAERCIEVVGAKSQVRYEGFEEGESSPQFGLDRLETDWPRGKRTMLVNGLRLTAESLSENMTPLQKLCL